MHVYIDLDWLNDKQYHRQLVLSTPGGLLLTDIIFTEKSNYTDAHSKKKNISRTHAHAQADI